MFAKNSLKQLHLCWSRCMGILQVGSTVSVKKKITFKDVKTFTELTGDHNPVHADPQKAVVHGALLNGLVSAVIGTKLPGFGTLVVHQTLRFPRPCYVGDEVTVTVKVSEVRKLVQVDFQVVANEESEGKNVVLEGTAKLLCQGDSQL